jgi:cobalt-zinc-cadmium efflux system outer membrane protein
MNRSIPPGRRWILQALLILVSANVAATSPWLTRDQVEHRVLHENPDLQAARWSVQEARGRLRQAGRWANPSADTELRPHVNGMEWSIASGFTQQFPITSRLSRERKLSGVLVDLAEWEVAEAARQQVTEALLSHLEWQSVLTRRDLLLRQKANNLERIERARSSALQGEGSTMDAEQFVLEGLQLTRQAMELEQRLASVRGALARRLGIVPDLLPERTEPLPDWRLQDLPETADPWRRRPDFVAAERRMEAAHEGIRLAQAGRWEDVSLGLYGERDRNEDLPDGLQTDHRVGIRLQVPLPLWNRNQGNIETARATLARVERESDALRRRILAEVETLAREWTAARTLTEHMHDRLLPQARRLEDSLLQSHQAGQLPLLDALRARDQRLQLEGGAIDATQGLLSIRLRMESALGHIPARPLVGSAASPSPALPPVGSAPQ